MAAILALPLEIISHIFACVDRDSRRNLRLVHSLFNTIGQRWVFRSTQLAPTPRSCDHFEKVLETPDLIRFVRKVYLQTYDEDTQGDSDGEDEYELSDPEDELVRPRRFWSLFERLKEFPQLQSVALCFHHTCVEETSDHWVDDIPQDINFRSTVMQRFTDVVASLPHLPQELIIQDLQNINDTDSTVVANIRKILGGLKSLRLNITNEHSEGNGETDLERDAPHEFFPELSSFWLKPALSSLEHLTIYSSNYFGFYPKCDLRGTHFPRLESLALGNYTFVHDSQLDWILSHAPTLTGLYLDDCPILYEVAIRDKERTYLDPADLQPDPRFDGEGYASYDKRWKDYFQAFKEGLPLLQHFRYGHCLAWWEHDTTPLECETEIEVALRHDSYMVYCDGYGPSQYMAHMIYTIRQEGDIKWEDGEPLRCTDEDINALKELCAKLRQPLANDGWNPVDS
ncbi:hypothetical protein P175DRAFT_0481806 [Aspergillus ochraceoroseus IBT 24754]|uniref:F-box domain-containing protein n=1 Tax=Aspergillus ochraceoroseus IBT 24754 TaxID=1392256 RepID=A0A2T5LVW7_9EURO|nr:uncharacterized protein P175DRAFT_0481806 [Aspergillus ochraceoroseus IBT 24754]PTU20426.1 hypothetical protein P175DRAFT_0481806 [Aspergillus ochraceoroseus IBT 24754]